MCQSARHTFRRHGRPSCCGRNRRCTLHENLFFTAILWIGLFALGALRSPFRGAAIPLASDAILYVLVLLGAYLAGRSEPKLRAIFIRAITAMVIVLACAALWQVAVDLPRLRTLIQTGEAIMPDALNSKIGLDRLNGDDAFATFGNPNSLAAYLIVGFFLVLGHAWPFIPATHSKRDWLHTLLVAFFALIILLALYWTGSKGGFVSLLFGGWFFALQRLNTRFPILNTLTILGLAAVISLLVLGFFDVIPARFFGLSMQVRFEYWKSAMAMFSQNPLTGVGVGGYGEWFPTFKTPLGWESKDPHNEFVCLLTELGVLGPVVYALIWWLVLRYSGKPSLPNDDAPTLAKLKWTDLELLTPIAGTMCFAFFIAMAGVFNASDIFSVLQGNAPKIAWLCAAQTAFLPVLFLLVFLALRKNVAPNTNDSNALLHGFRAAAGAILIHQLVDFDFKAQAVMISLFLCGGTFWGAADATQLEINPSTSMLARASGWLTVVFGLLMIPTAFVYPFNSGAARSEAQELQSYFQLITAQPDKAKGDLSPDETRAAILSARTRATESVPFDSEAIMDLAIARLTFERHPPFSQNDNSILDQLTHASTLRPLSAQPLVMIGGLHFHRGLAAPDNEKRAHFLKAREAYSSARARYPLHPGFAFMEGDAWLMMDEPLKACERFAAAFETDIDINDPNVCIGSSFNDPRPGVFSRHSSDSKILDAINALLQSADPNTKTLRSNSRLMLGLLARRTTAIANLVNESKRAGTSAGMNAIALKEELMKTTKEMMEQSSDLRSNAHAALLHALCVKAHAPEKSTPAIDRAQQLEIESERNNTPGTVRWLFTELLKR